MRESATRLLTRSVVLDAGTLLDGIEQGIARAAGTEGRRLVSATVEVETTTDPSAIAAGSRLATDRWFCWEQPDRDFALAGIGTATEVVSRGPERFRELAEGCSRALRDRVAAEPEELAAGAGPIWTAGFAFAPEGGSEPIWSSLPPALAVLPEVAIARTRDGAWLTASALVDRRSSAETVLDRIEGRLASLRATPLTPADPHPSAASSIAGRHPPERYERIVASAVERIGAGELDKVVLARELTVEAPAAHDPAALLGSLRGLFPSCFCFCFGTPEAAFVGASPELLVRRSGAVAGTVALAGTTSRSADPAVDGHLGEAMLHSPKVRDEHRIVVQRIERTLRPHAVWVHAESEPSVIKVGNLQHLATPIRAQLAEARSAIALAGALHPTPAIGGEPRDRAVELIEELEGIDRGWYTGPVGWMDAADDGEICVGLRSALLRDREAHLFAGCGIVADSDPASELQESELKFEVLLPLLAS
ncbi:MAG TPA: isochorismate synthase [Solirubrobacterales bacterium]|nr:isochorismate synthase [Solirubrobacterales bacterium]